jgi:hypothetical protein
LNREPFWEQKQFLMIDIENGCKILYINIILTKLITQEDILQIQYKCSNSLWRIVIALHVLILSNSWKIADSEIHEESYIWRYYTSTWTLQLGAFMNIISKFYRN